MKNVYQSALKASVFNKNMEYTPKRDKKKNRKRKIIGFNPPFSSNVKTNIGKLFLKLVKKHFPRHHKFYKIFNPNTIKLSYSCMLNVSTIIKQHNARVLQSQPCNQCPPCNCGNQRDCPLDGLCNSSSIVYQATVTLENPEISDNPENVYFGICEGSFKPRYRNHLKSFNNRRYKTDTELSEHIWKLKDRGMSYSIKWDIKSRASSYKCGTKRCDLCVTEKVIIARCNHKGLLNKRSELMSKCRPRNKFILKNF